MKCLTIVLICLVALVAGEEEWKPPNAQQQAALYDDCGKQAGVTFEQVIRIISREHPNERESREFMFCYVKNWGVFSEESGYNVDRYVATLSLLPIDTEKARAIVSKCADRNEQNSSAMEWAYRGMECMKENKIDEVAREGFLKAIINSANKWSKLQ